MGGYDSVTRCLLNNNSFDTGGPGGGMHLLCAILVVAVYNFKIRQFGSCSVAYYFRRRR